ncbi:MAG: type II toxin-antitoxin system RelE/ParE family toxin [Anaerosomatales bacterium]|nr:type II toxin-antitoxin system RelE/ParE family toxin [Anaerosomatales bacterium]MDT8434244.1 type II toxin-antitoxin system RelE/ParE family toxin [Anaerosomatales bacterium]
MGSYEVRFRTSVRKDLRRIPSADVARIMERIGALADDPRPPGAEKLSTRERYRIRQGDYRIIYEVEDRVVTVWVVKVGHRRDVYRR